MSKRDKFEIGELVKIECLLEEFNGRYGLVMKHYEDDVLEYVVLAGKDLIALFREELIKV